MHSANLTEDHIDVQNLRFANNTGTSLSETIILTQLPIIFNFVTILMFSFYSSTVTYSCRLFVFEFISTVLTCVLFLTVYSDIVFQLYLFCWLVAILILIVICAKCNIKQHWAVMQRKSLRDERLPCITHFRGYVNIYSIICILAADFSCFPRRFLKTEFCGFGLMDTGVGLFVVAYAFSSSHFSSKSSSTSVFRKIFPLLVVGVGRFISTSAVNYQHQVSEYGTQWNFFITLSILTLVNETAFRFVRSIKCVIMAAVILLLVHECVLTAGVKDWIMGNAPRSNFISGNREGIFSLPGYEVIYLFGVVIRHSLPKDGTYRKYSDILPAYVTGFFVSILLTKVTEYEFGVSRRTANSGYVFWILGITFVSLVKLITLELFTCSMLNNKQMSRVEVVPQIVKSANFNGFAVFLVGNVLTGIINLSVRTLTFSNASGVVIISLYMLCCCGFSMILYRKRLRLR